MNDGVERCHRISYSLLNKKALRQAADPGARKPFFFVAISNQELSGRLGDEQAVLTIPTWPILTEFTSLDRLADKLLEHVYAADPVGPYRLGGFCFGGVVALEMARKLAAAGRRVDLLALMETPWPEHSIHRCRVIWTIQRLLVACLFPSELMHEIAVYGGRFLGHLRWGGPDEHERFERHLAQCVKETLANYTPRTYPGRLTLFLGDRSPFRFFTASAWRNVAERGADVHIVPGSHEGVFGRDDLARQLKTCLDGLDRTSSPEPSASSPPAGA